MRKQILIAAASIFTIACTDNNSGSQDEHHHDSSSAKQVKDTSKKSLPAEASAIVAGASINIKYHSPAVRGRIIWGGLIPYDEVWVTGAHSATTIEVNKNFVVAGKNIAAGKYALFTIPSKAEWTIIINKNWDQHLADEYSDKEDVIRVKVKPESSNAITERLKYEIRPNGEKSANILISWEKIRVSFPLEMK